MFRKVLPEELRRFRRVLRRIRTCRCNQQRIRRNQLLRNLYFNPTVAVSAVCTGCEAEHSAGEVFGCSAVFNLINGFIACVVGYNNLDVFAGCFIECDSSAAGFTSFFLYRNAACDNLAANSLKNLYSCNVLVILSSDCYRACKKILVK